MDASVAAREPSPTIVWPARLVHGICHYHRQWIPGDERGFRSRGHRIHSSGDYRNRPPLDEHSGLRKWVQRNMRDKPVRLSYEQSMVVGGAFVQKLARMDCQVMILACGPTHVHVLFQPSEDQVVRQLGKAKQFASLKCLDRRGQLWGELSDVEDVIGPDDAKRVFRYIEDHRDEGAWIWRCDRVAPAAS